jgi:hypothetical protein
MLFCSPSSNSACRHAVRTISSSIFIDVWRIVSEDTLLSKLKEGGETQGVSPKEMGAGIGWQYLTTLASLWSLTTPGCYLEFRFRKGYSPATPVKTSSILSPQSIPCTRLNYSRRFFRLFQHIKTKEQFSFFQSRQTKSFLLIDRTGRVVTLSSSAGYDGYSSK